MSMGGLAANRSVLNGALNMMTLAQLEHLYEVESGTLRDLEALWFGGSSDHQDGLLKELEFIVFRIKERMEMLETGTSEGDLYFACIKCEVVFGTEMGVDSVCPVCGGIKWLRLVRRKNTPKS